MLEVAAHSLLPLFDTITFRSSPASALLKIITLDPQQRFLLNSILFSQTPTTTADTGSDDEI
jgi:hypothetical protein